MIYRNWMKYIKDDVKLTEVIMPGTHNSGSYGMTPMACCQDGTFYDQFAHGVRHFCIRYRGDKNCGVVMSHGVAKGRPLAEGLQSMRRMIEENDSEFFVFDMREYYPQKLGPVNLTYPAEDRDVEELIQKYLDADNYCYTDYESASEITFEKLRKSKKRFIIINYRNAYRWCRDCNQIFAWNPELHGKKAETFSREVLTHFDSAETNSIYWFQTQQTPNLGSEVGFLVTPRKLDKGLQPYFADIINSIRDNPLYLKKANVISGDFMSESYGKCREILKLNLVKGTVKDELQEEFAKELEKDYDL